MACDETFVDLSPLLAKLVALLNRDNIDEAFLLIHRCLSGKYDSKKETQGSREERVMREVMEKTNECAMVMLKKGH